ASEVERLYVHLGQAYVFQNDWEQAQEAYEELLAYAKQHQLAALASMTLNRLAILAIQQSNGKPTVRALLDEAWHIAEGSHDQKALAETAWNLAQITGIMWEDLTSSLRHGELALSLARARHDQELEARSLYILGVISLYRGDVEGTMHYVETSLALYATIRTEPTFSGELSLPHFVSGAPLTQALTHRTSEAWCWGLLALTQVYAGQVLGSIHSGRRALALSTESKNGWAQVLSTAYLTYGLLDAGAFEEALELMQAAMALARTLPPMLSFQRLLTALGMTYHAVQQWQEARSTLEEAEAVAETLDLGRLRVVTLSQLCMNCALTGEWGQAHTYAVQAMALRESIDRAMIPQDFSFHYETEALLRGGDERQARVAAGLAADLGLPGERWQIQAALGTLYEAAGEPVQARTAFGEAATIIQGLAEGIKDEALRSRFLAGPPIQQVLQQAHRVANQVPQDQAEQGGAPRRVVLQTDESWEAS
ncbi:MAG: tetratricopeptide repeat protein, partial [Chloroflexi bacterium]